MKKTYLFIAVVLLLFSTFPLCAQVDQEMEKESFFRGFGFQFEQDFLLEFMGLPDLNEDQNYTQGIGFSLFTKPIGTHFILTKEANKSGYRYHYPSEFVLQFAAFTPDDLRQEDPVIGDRPYATVVLGGVKSTIMDPEKKQLVSQSFYLGFMGWDGPAEAIQTWIHKGMNENNTQRPYNPEGWHNQISNGGEPTIQFSRNAVKLLTTKGLEEEVNAKAKSGSFTKNLATANFTIEVGYITQISGGLTYKFGRLDYSKWGHNLFSQLNTIAEFVGDGREEERNLNDHYYDLDKEWELYLFGSIQPAITVYNGSLHGGFKETAYRLPYSQTNFLTGQGRLGIGWNSKCHSLGIYYAAKVPEMRNSYSRFHLWSGISFAYHP